MGFLIRGRLAWIASIVLGAVLLVIGLIKGIVFLSIAGGGFLLFGIVFLILSLVTKGRTD